MDDEVRPNSDTVRLYAFLMFLFDDRIAVKLPARRRVFSAVRSSP
jgi:hypothetical protein